MPVHDPSRSPTSAAARGSVSGSIRGSIRASVRGWLKSDMRVLRWVFLALYVVIAGGLFAYALSQTWGETFLIVTLIGIVVAQLLLVLGSGTVRLCHPIR